MRYIFLLVGSFLTVLFIIQLIKGKKYAFMIQNLSDNDFPLHELYGVGFAWSAIKIFALKNKTAEKLKADATMLYELKYAEYYANLIWAQTITFVHLFLTIIFLAAAIMYGSVVFIFAVGIFMCVVIAMYCLQNMKNTISKRTEECEGELPEVVSTMAVLVNSGMVLKDAWQTVGESGEGAFYDLMQQASENMNNGYSDADAIFLFGKLSNSTEIKKFVSALLQSMGKGGAELSVFLANQSSELWNARRQFMLQSGEKAATKLLMPILLIFLGVIIIVLTAAFAGSIF